MKSSRVDAAALEEKLQTSNKHLLQKESEINSIL